MFMGEYRHTVDPKGRLIVPSKFRELLGAEFVVTRGLDGCLFVYPMDSWEAYVADLKKLPLTDKNARLFMRFIVAGATTCELDKQGRILLPATLREFAGLEKDVLLAGMLDHIEIWNEERWKENADFGDMDMIASHLNLIIILSCYMRLSKNFIFSLTESMWMGRSGAVDMHMRSAAAYRIGVIFMELTRMQRQFRQQGNGFLVSGRKCLLSEAITARWCRS